MVAYSNLCVLFTTLFFSHSVLAECSDWVSTPEEALSIQISDKTLIKRYKEANTRCRGISPNSIEMYEGCALRTMYSGLLNMRQYCFGKKGQASYQMSWHKCETSSILPPDCNAMASTSQTVPQRMSNQTPKPKPEAKGVQQPSNSGSDWIKEQGWISQAKEAVLDRLKDPDSASFRNVFFSRGRDNVPMACGEVNSKNSFGGKEGFQHFLSAGTPELTFLEEEVEDFANAWNRFCKNPPKR